MTTNEYETMLQEFKRKHGRRKVDISVNAYERLQELNNLMIEKCNTHDISLSDTVEIAISATYHDLAKE